MRKIRRILVAVKDPWARVLDRLPCDVLIVKPQRFASRVPRARRGARLVALSAIQPGI